VTLTDFSYPVYVLWFSSSHFFKIFICPLNILTLRT
jgi:hypothetical protein